MKLKEYLWIVRKNIINISNTLFVIFLSLCLVIIITCFTLKININNYISGILNSINYRLITVTSLNDEELDFKKIMSLEHIKSNFQTKYLYGRSYEISEFKNNGLNGVVNFEQFLDGDNIKIVNGKTLDENKSGYAICATNFYPDSQEEDIKFEKIINDKNLIGTKLNIEEELEVEIIGTFDINNSSYTKNTCLLTYNDTKKLRDSIMKEESWFLENNDYTILVDDGSYVSSVIDELSKLGYYSNSSISLDIESIDNINNITNIIIIMTGLCTFLLILLFTKKRYVYLKKKLLLYKYLGFQNNNVYIIGEFQNLIINIIAIGITMIVYIIIKYLVQHVFWNESLYYGLILAITLKELLLIFLSIMILTSFLSYIYIKKILK